MPSFTNVNGKLYFALDQLDYGIELWTSDGTPAGSTLLLDLHPGRSDGLTQVSGKSPLVQSGNRIFFGGNDGYFSQELWQYDLLTKTSTIVSDLNLLPASTNPVAAVATGQGLFFGSNFGANTTGWLWRSDGDSGAERLAVFNEASFASSPAYFLDAGPVTYFYGGKSDTGFELWKTDGTSSGTAIVSDWIPGPGDSRSSGLSAQNMTVLNGKLFFRTATVSEGESLALTTVDSHEISVVRSSTPGLKPSAPTLMASVGNTLYFSAVDSGSNRELWRTDGTSAGTMMIKDIDGTTAASLGTSFAVLGNKLIFNAATASSGRELWISDGTSVGTMLLRDIYVGNNTAGTPNSGLTSAALTATAGAYTYFLANDGLTGVELWRTDGTSVGTTIVRDLAAGTASSTIGAFFPLGSWLYFTCNNATNGNELWRTDGTSGGTTLVKDIRPGTGSSNPANFTNVLNVLYFTANNGVNGPELLRSDGTSSGTTLIDLEAGTNANPSLLIARNDRLYFAANSSTAGRELFMLTEDAFPPALLRIDSPSPGGVYTTGQSVELRLTFSEPVTLSNGNLLISLDSGAVLNIAPFTGTTAAVTYIVQAGQTSPDLSVTGISLGSGAVLTDLAGNAYLPGLPGQNLGATVNFLVNPLPPTTVTALMLNLGEVQRSRMTAIQLVFDVPVNAAHITRPDFIRLNRVGGGMPVSLTSGAGLVISPSSGAVNSLTINFQDDPGVEHGSLADGRWQISIPWLQYTGPVFHRLFGDYDGNGTVDATDFSFFPAFGASVGSAFDFNNNGDIDSGTDFSEFGNRFGLTL